jgi:hypothetical protein
MTLPRRMNFLNSANIFFPFYPQTVYKNRLSRIPVLSMGAMLNTGTMALLNESFPKVKLIIQGEFSEIKTPGDRFVL